MMSRCGWCCDAEQPCTEHECHEYRDGRHQFDAPCSDSSHGHDAGARVCVCGTPLLDDARAPWGGYADELPERDYFEGE